MGNSHSKGEVRSHTNVLIGNKVYVWGGYTYNLPFHHDSQKKKSILSSIDIYSLRDGKCINQSTKGELPNAAVFYRACAVKDRIYYFGGRCESNNCFHSDLHVLDTRHFYWRFIPCTHGPMNKTACGMVSFKIAEEDHIMVIAGRGPVPHDQQPQSTYRITHDDKHRCYTNEIHVMNITTHEGQWRTIPNRLGDIFPPTAFFSMNALSNNKAIIFGGVYLDDEGKHNHSDNVFILTYGRNAVEFKHLIQSEHSRWPRARDGHASVVIECVTTNRTRKQYLAVLGGLCENKTILSDFWVMDIEEKSWKKIYDNFEEIDMESICKRFDHSITSLRMSCNCYWLLITGGRITRADLVKGPDALILIEIVYSIREDSWNLSKVIKGDKLKNTSKLLKLISERFAEGREENEEILHLINEIEQRKNVQVQNLRDQLHEQFELHMKKQQVFDDERTEFVRAQISFNECLREHKEEVRDLKRIRDQSREECEQLNRTLQQMEHELRERENTIERLQDQLNNRSWVVQENEIKRTREIACGAYGVVHIAQFRGIEVAAKSLHEVIISDYNIGKFKDEMEMSSKLHHPNIVQFIGATCNMTVGKPTILYELMPTSLYGKLNVRPRSRFSRDDILDISSDVCSALVYLHLAPIPIIHRDVSSPNVLLERLDGGKWKSKLSDFGSARFQFNISKNFPGNMAYSAPEADNPKHHSPAMDVYSLGVLITELVLHLPPGDTHDKRVENAMTIRIQPIKQLVLDCLHQDTQRRITSSRLLEELKILNNEDSVV